MGLNVKLCDSCYTSLFGPLTFAFRRKASSNDWWVEVKHKTSLRNEIKSIKTKKVFVFL